MTKKNFQQLWELHYPDTVPISHFFKYVYLERWFRIHSLPASKRYADTETEWEILISRQNEIITDLLGIDMLTYLVTGEYLQTNGKLTSIVEEEIFKSFSFTQLDDIPLNIIAPEQYDKDVIYCPYFASIIWKPNYYNMILRAVADDDIRMFFVSFDKNIIVAPYDGGVDFVLKDQQTRDNYKNKYKEWLSEREDGL